MAKYINPYTDFGFKKLFGEEGNKNLLMDFLNQMLPAHHQIADLTFQNVEKLPDSSEERKAFFDIHCISATGERFIVEMQKAKIEYFKDRSLYYITYPIREQAQLGGWNFQLSAIYFIAVLDFWYEDKTKAKFYRSVMLKDQDNDSFYEKLQLFYLQMPAFTKTENQLVTKFDKWAYFLKNLENLDDIPQILQEPVFEQAFLAASVANFTQKQREEYEKSRLSYIEMKLVTETAQKEGLEKGLEEGLALGLEQGLAKGLEQGLEQGLAQGLEKGLEQGKIEKEIEAILGFYRNGISSSIIAMALNIEEIRVKEVIENHS